MRLDSAEIAGGAPFPSRRFCQPLAIPDLGDLRGFALDDRFSFFSPDGLQVLEDTLEDLQRPYPLGLTPKSLITLIAAL